MFNDRKNYRHYQNPKIKNYERKPESNLSLIVTIAVMLIGAYLIWLVLFGLIG
jgi:hypothetical protein